VANSYFPSSAGITHSYSFFSFTFLFTPPNLHSEPALCPTCTTSFCCTPWNIVPRLYLFPSHQPVSIGIPYTASHCILMSTLTLLSFTLVVAGHALAALYLLPVRLHLALVAPSCHPQSHHRYNNMHTAIPHLVTLPSLSSWALPLPLYLSCLINPPVSRRNIHIPLPAIRT